MSPWQMLLGSELSSGCRAAGPVVVWSPLTHPALPSPETIRAVHRVGWPPGAGPQGSDPALLPPCYVTFGNLHDLPESLLLHYKQEPPKYLFQRVVAKLNKMVSKWPARVRFIVCVIVVIYTHRAMKYSRKIWFSRARLLSSVLTDPSVSGLSSPSYC